MGAESRKNRLRGSRSVRGPPAVFILFYLLTAVLCYNIEMDQFCQVPKLNFACINCNSLNMSSIGNLNHLLKIYGITSLKTDIVLLSDIRLCNAAGGSNIAELNTSFKINPHCSYKFFHHSTKTREELVYLLNTPFHLQFLERQETRTKTIWLYTWRSKVKE